MAFKIFGHHARITLKPNASIAFITRLIHLASLIWIKLDVATSIGELHLYCKSGREV
jgi:hypothetical protein